MRIFLKLRAEEESDGKRNLGVPFYQGTQPPVRKRRRKGAGTREVR